MEPAAPQVLAKLVSTNKARVRNLELTADTPAITVGRDPSNTVAIPDLRISGFHCVFEVVTEQTDVKFRVEDKSSNGTFVNQKKIGRGNTVWLQNGDEIVLLSEALVGPTDTLGFSFVLSELSLKRKLPAAEATEPKKPKVEVKLSEDLDCVICTEIIHQCVTLMPCLHNCCGGCYSLWMDRSTECPSCRAQVSEVRRNATVSNIIETYLASNPELRRPQEELKEREATNKITHDSIIIGKRLENPAGKPEKAQKCAQCDKAVDGFKCKANQEHVQCAQCHVLLPVRNPSRIHCSICRTVNCSVYLNSQNCRNLLGSLQSFPELLATIPASAFKSNEVERQLLQDYIVGARQRLPAIAEEMVTDMELQNWDLPIEDHGRVKVNRNSLLCKECAVKVWCELLYLYRVKINHLVPKFVRNKPNCAHGRECRTQRKRDHATRYNHVCEKQ